MTVTLCVKFLFDELCASGAFPAGAANFFQRLLAVLDCSIFDRTFPSSAAGGGGSSHCKTTTHFTRLKHLQNRHESVAADAKDIGKQLTNTTAIFRLTNRLNMTQRRNMQFRMWRFQVAMTRERAKIFQFGKKEQKKPKRANMDLVAPFLFWRAWAKHSKLSNQLATEVHKLSALIGSLKQHSAAKGRDNVQLSDSIRLLNSQLEAMESSARFRPIRPDPAFTDKFIDTLFVRCETELQMIKDLPNGFYPLFTLGVRFRDASSLPYADTLNDLVKSLSTLGKNAQWDSRAEVMEEIELALREEVGQETEAYEDLLAMDVEDLLVEWANRALRLSPGVSLASGKVSVRPLKDLSTDLRDSELYVRILRVVAPQLPVRKVENMLDLHARAKGILTLLKSMGCLEVMNEYEYVEGDPVMHLMQLAVLFAHSHGLTAEPNREWFSARESNIQFLRDKWTNIKYLDNIPEDAAQSFLSQVLHMSTEISVLRQRVVRRSHYFTKTRANIYQFVCVLYKATMAPGEGAAYEVKHLSDTFSSMVEEEKVGRALNSSDPDLITSETAATRKVVSKHRQEIKKVCRHYIAESSAGPGCIDWKSYLSFARDCGIVTGSNRVSIADLVRVYNTAAQEEVVVGVIKGSEDKAEDDEEADQKFKEPTHELNQAQFIDCIVQLAGCRHYKKNGISHSVLLFMERDILPNACRTSVDDFRKLISQEGIRQIFNVCNNKLTAIFRRYSSLDDSSEESQDNMFSMNEIEFLEMVNDARLLKNPNLNERKIKTIFAHVQQNDDFGEDDPSLDLEMDYNEFCEALVSLCINVLPDPFVPLSQKLEGFLDKYIIGPLTGGGQA
mmetsp:Transcript_19158/g.37875  ORF Transcript_19158/g.37875 Transcript_19158/m.37875 type:complete len:842 (-) Transcript_19158:2631-5156(-)